MTEPHRWSRRISVVGAAAVLLGAFDPLEGSAIILPGSGLLALGSYVGGDAPRTRAYLVWGFVLVAIGVGAMFGMSAIGGIGGTSGRSRWWALLIVPYAIGWVIDVWGPGAPKWLRMSGFVVLAWYAILARMILQRRLSGA